MEEKANNKAGINILHLQVSSVDQLAAIYLPYIKNGGIFIPTEAEFSLADQAFLLITLPGEEMKLALCVTVVWINPSASQIWKTPGIGVRFTDAENKARAKIENVLPEARHKLQRLFTM